MPKKMTVRKFKKSVDVGQSAGYEYQSTLAQRLQHSARVKAQIDAHVKEENKKGK